MAENERRQYQRIPFIADVLLRQNDQQWSCALEDISLKGILIIAPDDISPVQDEAYTVELVLGEGATINMQAKISHTTQSHWGMQWENIDLEGLTHLRRLLELNMDDPNEMHREMAELG
jgi:c-di-GMP-binding flagellar brake protein YcgR